MAGELSKTFGPNKIFLTPKIFMHCLIRHALYEVFKSGLKLDIIIYWKLYKNRRKASGWSKYFRFIRIGGTWKNWRREKRGIAKAMSLTLALYTHLEFKFWRLLTVTLNLQQIIHVSHFVAAFCLRTWGARGNFVYFFLVLPFCVSQHDDFWTSS